MVTGGGVGTYVNELAVLRQAALIVGGGGCRLVSYVSNVWVAVYRYETIFCTVRKAYPIVIHIQERGF